MNVVLLGSSGPLNLKVAYCLARLRVVVHVIATSASNIVRKSRHVDSFTVHEGVSDERAPSETVLWLHHYCRKNAIEVIVPGDIGTAGFLSAAAGSIPDVAIYPCSSADVLHRIHDKWIFASTLMAAGIATPKTALIRSQADVSSAVEEIGFPLMVKPLSGESSHGVVRFDSEEQLAEHLASGKPYSIPPLIGQRFIAGRDIDISVLADHGRVIAGVTQRLEPDGSLEFLYDPSTRRLAEDVVAEYGYHGIAHFDMRIDAASGETYVLECNPRFWYSMPASMWQGVNFVDAGIRFAKRQVVDDDARLVPGRYFLPGALLSALRRRPSLLKELTRRNIVGVLQPALDPIPHLADLYRKRHGRRA